MINTFTLPVGLIFLLVFCTFTRAETPTTFPARTKVSIEGERWLINGQVTYAGMAAEGLLMNVRMVNAVFEDLGPAGQGKLPKGFDPQANTETFLKVMPDYIAHGMRAFTINLQGGGPGYEGAINSAYEQDGSLRESYLARVRQVIETADRNGAVIILGCFYQRQNQSLTGRPAIENAVRNVAGWIRDSGYTNVVLEISNEFNHKGFQQWPDGAWLASPAGQVELMKLARQTHPGLLVSTSGLGGGAVADEVAQTADFILVHYNNTPIAEIPGKAARMQKFGKPVVVNEDTKVGQVGARAAQVCVASGISWGHMHNSKNQYVPFEFEGSADDPVVYGAVKTLTTRPRLAQPTTATAPTELSAVIALPQDGTGFRVGQAIDIKVGVEGPIARLELLSDGREIGRLAAPPWTFIWTDAPVGKHDLTVRAFDSAGRSVESFPVDIVVEEE